MRAKRHQLIHCDGVQIGWDLIGIHGLPTFKFRIMFEANNEILERSIDPIVEQELI